MSSNPELVSKVHAITEAVSASHSAINENFQDFRSRLETLEAGQDRPRIPAAGTKPVATFFDAKSGQPMHGLTHGQKVASVVAENKSGITLGRWLRGMALGDRADDARENREMQKALATSPDASGGYTVPAPLAAEFIDLLRARMVLSQAGATTIPMTSETHKIARVTADPTFSWHIENAAITASDPTLSAATLKACTVVGVVKFSLELAQDSINIENMLTRVLSQGAATAIDAAGLVGTGQVTSPIGHSPTGVANFTNRNTVTSVGVPTNYGCVADAITKLLVANVPLERIGALIYHPYLWSKWSKLATGITSDKTQLPLPSYMQGRPQLVTTAAAVTGSPTTTTAFLADWSSLLFGIRQQVTVQFLNQVFLASNLQVAALVYARVDFQPARATDFATMEGITVGSG